MRLSGIQPFTLLDFPGKIACITFTPGCNFRCGYCHNPEFVLPEKLREIKDSFIDEEVFFSFLKKRQGLLDGVVVSGGEPTMMYDLISFMEKIKALGFLVKLDTNGNKPEVLREAIEKKVIDYVAMDIKTTPAKYKELVGGLAQEERLQESIALLKTNIVPYEFRTTLVKEIHTSAILEEMAKTISGAPKLYLQTFRPDHVLDPKFSLFHPFTMSEMEMAKDIFATAVGEVYIR